MSKRGFRIAGYVLGGAAVLTAGLLVAARLMRTYSSHGSPYVSDTGDNLVIPPAERGERPPTKAEYSLIMLARAKGWPTDDPNVRFGTDSYGPYLLVQVESGDMRVEFVKDSSEYFQVVTYANGKPAPTVLKGQSPEYFATTATVHSLVNDRWSGASADEVALLQLVERCGWPVNDKDVFVRCGTKGIGSPYVEFKIDGTVLTLEFPSDDQTGFAITNSVGRSISDFLAGLNPSYASAVEELSDSNS